MTLGEYQEQKRPFPYESEADWDARTFKEYLREYHLGPLLSTLTRTGAVDPEALYTILDALIEAAK